jgi:hypothetical protein
MDIICGFILILTSNQHLENPHFPVSTTDLGKRSGFFYRRSEEIADELQPVAVIGPAGWIAIGFGGLALIGTATAIIVIVQSRNGRIMMSEED